VTKLNLTLVSLVAALPAAALTILLVMGFVNYAGGPTGVKVIAGLTLLIAAGVAAMPAGIFFLSGPRAEKPPKEKGKGKDEKKEEAASESAVAVADDLSADEGAVEVDEETAIADSEDFAETITQPAIEGESDDFDMGGEFELDDDDDAGAKKRK